MPPGNAAGRWPRLASLLLVAVGLLLRTYHYASDPSIWFDEASLMLNALDKSYPELLGPLDHAANGPPLFLWLEKALAENVGDTPWAWRLPAFVASCAGMVLFYFVARRALPEGAVPWAVGLFAVSDRLLFHTPEVKPYTTDVLAATGLVGVWLWTTNWPAARRLLLFAALGAPLLGLSYPSVFVLGGLTVALLPDVWRDRRSPAAWAAFGLYAAALGGTLVWLVTGPVRAQSEGIKSAGFEWVGQMPDWSDPGRFAAWLPAAVFDVFRYCLHPTGGFLAAVAAVGAAWLVRAGRGRLVVLLLTPLALAVAAACLHKYPCGHGRPMLFMTPAAALMVGAAVPPVLRWCASGATPARRAAGLVLALVVAGLVLAPAVATAVRLVVPWPRPDCRGAAEYVLGNLEPGDRAVVTSWDQIYFYRGLDPARKCGWDAVTDGHDRRLWVGYHAGFLQLPPDVYAAGSNTWRVTRRRSFGTMTVVALERVEPPRSGP